MKKTFYFNLPVLILVGFYLFNRTEKINTSESVIKISNSNKELFLGKRQAIAQRADIKSKDDCVDLLNALNDLDFNFSPEEVISKFDRKFFSACTNSEVKDRIRLVQEGCFADKPKQECVMHMVFLRSLLRTRNTTDSDNNEMLADLIIKEFANNNPDFKKMEKNLSKLMDNNPSNEAIQKLWAMTKLLSQDDLKNLPENLKDEIYARINPDLLDNPELKSLRLFLESGLDPVKAENFARDYIRQNPNQSDSHEILGWALWNQNRRAEAISQLEMAMRLNPKDQWLKEMYEKVNSPLAKKETYMGRLNLGVRLEDLF